MTQEQKAIAYDRALKYARIYYTNGNEDMKMMMKTCFPVLVEESEDERIRKKLISLVKNWDKGGIVSKYTSDANEIKLILAWLEKQGEQKHTDNIEPKFHEGEWVVFNNRHDSVYQVEKIENYEYTLRHFLGGSMPLSFSHEDMIRAWTVKDVRDGDVLAYVTDEEDLWIMIYWSLYEPYEGHVHYHALLVNDKFSDKGTCCICINDLKPATKEQRDLLFQKMKETGYEWSDKDRKLIKIVK